MFFSLQSLIDRQILLWGANLPFGVIILEKQQQQKDIILQNMGD